VNADKKQTRNDSSTSHVIEFVRGLIDHGELRPGSRMPAERELASLTGVSRPTVRAALQALAAMGVVKTRHGAGTFISEKPLFESESLRIMAAVHGFSREDMFEARRLLEVSAAGMAAERATSEQMAALSEEVSDMFASMNDPQAFLVHDIRFHRVIAAASGNPIVASLVEMVSSLFYDTRRATASRATESNMQDAAEMHRQIYKAIRGRKPDRARTLMNEHLLSASAHLAAEEAPSGATDRT
jgi:GntR family transcriptional regulator, transcriptional repressor for pyruvate dehydrogenase complex